MNVISNQWWKRSVVYQVYPRSFQDSNGDGIGDLQGIIRRIPHLAYMGVDVLWICPMYASPNDDNGYDISDYRAIDPQYGTMDDMKTLLRTAKDNGIKVLLDLVVNHTSDEHPWFIESRSSRDNPKRDWYIWKNGIDGERPTEWPSHFGGSVWEWDERTGEYYFHAFSRKQPDLNWENPEVRRAVYDMMLWWIDQGISGFRVDAITFIKKNQDWPRTLDQEKLEFSILDGACCNHPGIMDFLREMRDEVLAPRGMVTVAEAPGVPLSDMESFMGEKDGVFSMIFTFDHMDMDVRFESPFRLFPWSLSDWKNRMTKWQRTIGDSGWLGLFLENHDQPRAVSRFGDPGKFRQVSAKTLATWYFLMRGTPFIFEGQEIGMANYPFSSIGEYRDIASLNAYRDAIAAGVSENDVMKYLLGRSRDNARTPMQWDKGPEAGFTDGKPWIAVNPDHATFNVEAQRGDESSILEHYRKLIALRRNRDVFAYGDFTELAADSDTVGGYRRRLGEESATVWCNFSADPAVLPEAASGDIVLNTHDHFDGKNLAPWQSVVSLRGKT
jgi:oligo-1,6-glucosidase/alpha-glucosidase